jgi:erythromycin esterase-like protein
MLCALLLPLLQLDKAAADAAEYKAGFDKYAADAAEYKAGYDKLSADNAEQAAQLDKAAADAMEYKAGYDKFAADAAEFKAGYDKLLVDTTEQKAQVGACRGVFSDASVGEATLTACSGCMGAWVHTLGSTEAVSQSTPAVDSSSEVPFPQELLHMIKPDFSCVLCV